MSKYRINTPEKRKLIADMVANNPDMPSKQLGRFIYTKHAELFPNEDAAYQAVRFRRGALGNYLRQHNRKIHGKTYQNRSGYVWRMPQSLTKPWEPYILPEGTTLCIQDMHVPFHDDNAMSAVISYGRKLKPNTVLINGDGGDFYGVSTWDRNPSKEDLWGEIRQQRAMLGTLRQEFPKAKILWKLGNHEERWERYIARKAKELWGLPFIEFGHMMTQAIPEGDNISAEPAIGSKENGDEIIFIKDQRIIRAGEHLGILHGHELPKGTTNPVSFARTLFLKAMECCIAGHHHRTSQHDGRTMFGRQIACWSMGCLCGLTPEYARINQWNHGFGVITLKDGTFKFENLRIINGKVY